MTKRRIRAPERRQVIKSSFLNNLADDVNDLNDQFVKKPTDPNSVPAEVQNEDDTNPLTTYTESARATSTIQVYDQNDENYAEVQRIESISFTNAEGHILTLIFSN